VGLSLFFFPREQGSPLPGQVPAGIPFHPETEKVAVKTQSSRDKARLKGFLVRQVPKIILLAVVRFWVDPLPSGKPQFSHL
jgi:hypothetical protein